MIGQKGNGFIGCTKMEKNILKHFREGFQQSVFHCVTDLFWIFLANLGEKMPNKGICTVKKWWPEDVSHILILEIHKI